MDWVAIRNIEAPFIPRLRSITDTSYFPTDELEQVPDEPVGADSTGANKDLAFLGCVVQTSSLHHRSVSFGVSTGVQIHVQAVHDIFGCVLSTVAVLSRIGSPFLPLRLRSLSLRRPVCTDSFLSMAL